MKSKKHSYDSGKDPSESEYREALRVYELYKVLPHNNPTAVPADQSKLSHVNTYGYLPEVYVDQPFVCRLCGKRQIWRATSQKWYYEEAKGHTDAIAVECHDCRKAKKPN